MCGQDELFEKPRPFKLGNPASGVFQGLVGIQPEDARSLGNGNEPDAAGKRFQNSRVSNCELE